MPTCEVCYVRPGKWCNVCKAYICDECRPHYLRRFRAMLRRDLGV